MGRMKEILNARYAALYGEIKGKEKADSDHKKTVMLMALALVCFLVAGGVSIFGGERNAAEIKVDKDGSVTGIVRPGKGETSKTFSARIIAGKGSASCEYEKEIVIDTIDSDEDTSEKSLIGEETESEKLERKVDAAVRSINEDKGKKMIALPTQLDDGTKLTWKKEKRSDMPLVFIAFIFMAVCIYTSRYSRVKKEEAEARDSITRELPGFINKTVLLLEGGIVINDALMRIINDRKNLGQSSYFYDQLIQIEGRVTKTNSPLHVELSAFAKRSGVRELMRIANIISDNIDKGSDLTGKLAGESSMLWFARKKQAEEKGRLAETKLTMPLVILILVLVMITVAPALMEI